MRELKERQRMMLSAFEEVHQENAFAPEGCEIVEELDRGGMAVVYLAQQLEPRREVAIKVILPRFADDGTVRERFKREGRAMAALEHPGVLPVYQVGEWDGLPFIMMKLARGGTLQAVLEDGVPEFEKVVEWLIAAGEAVHYAHQQGVLHRDLKPGNLLFDEKGSIYVGDFGVAKLEFIEGDSGLTQTNTLFGTPNYFAPEVASGEASGGSVSADLYGMGAVLYECLTGQRPHEGGRTTNLAAQLRMVVEDDFKPVRRLRPEVPMDLAVICEKALAKRAEDRYGTVEAFVDDLRRYRDGRGILARSQGYPERAWRLMKQHPVQCVLVGLVVLLAFTTAMLSFPPGKGQNAEPAAASTQVEGKEVTVVESNQSWLNAYVWSDKAPPSPANDYALTMAGGWGLRTSPADSLYAGGANFPGNSLRIPAGTGLLIKQIRSEVASINRGEGDLILDGGRILFGPGGEKDFLWKKSGDASPVLRLNKLRVTSAKGSAIELNHNIQRALIDGALTGSGDVLLNAQKGRDASGAMVTFADVDGYTGVITVDGGLVLDFGSEVEFTGGITLCVGSQLNVDQVLKFSSGKLIDPINGVVPPGTYRGAALVALGDNYIDSNGAVIVGASR